MQGWPLPLLLFNVILEVLSNARQEVCGRGDIVFIHRWHVIYIENLKELIKKPRLISFFFFKKFKFYSLSRFQLYNTVLATIVTMLYIRSSELIHHIPDSLWPFTNLFLFYTPTNPWQPVFYSLFLWIQLFPFWCHI